MEYIQDVRSRENTELQAGLFEPPLRSITITIEEKGGRRDQRFPRKGGHSTFESTGYPVFCSSRLPYQARMI